MNRKNPLIMEKKWNIFSVRVQVRNILTVPEAGKKSEIAGYPVASRVFL